MDKPQKSWKREAGALTFFLFCIAFGFNHFDPKEGTTSILEMLAWPVIGVFVGAPVFHAYNAKNGKPSKPPEPGQ